MGKPASAGCCSRQSACRHGDHLQEDGMNCANHGGVAATAYCRACGKALCANCSRSVQGVVYCENCLAAKLGDVQPPVAAYAPPAVSAPRPARVSGAPSPGLAIA